MLTIRSIFLGFCFWFVSTCSPTVYGQPPMAVNGYMCALNCTFQHTSVWATVLSLKTPSEQLFNSLRPALPIIPLSNNPAAKQTDAIYRVCDVLDSLNDCLRRCPMDSFRQVVYNSLNGLTMLCSAPRGSLTSPNMMTNDAVACLNTYADSIKTMCVSENEKFLASTLQLKSISPSTSPVALVRMLQGVCESAIKQTTCVMPALNQKCDRSAGNIMNQIFQASIGSFYQLLGSNRHHSPDACRKLFDTVLPPGEDNSFIRLFMPTVSPTTAGFDNQSSLVFPAIFAAQPPVNISPAPVPFPFGPINVKMVNASLGNSSHSTNNSDPLDVQLKKIDELLSRDKSFHPRNQNSSLFNQTSSSPSPSNDVTLPTSGAVSAKIPKISIFVSISSIILFQFFRSSFLCK